MHVTLSVLFSLVVAWVDANWVHATTAPTTFVLQHHDVRDVAVILDEVLRPTCCPRRTSVVVRAAARPLPPSLRIGADVGRNAVRLRGRPEAVRKAIEVLRILDVPVTEAR